MVLHRRYPPHPGKYVINSIVVGNSGLPVCELNVITGQFGLLCRQAYRKVSKQESIQASK